MRQLHKFDKLVEALQELPTIGKKSASRLAYFMLMKDSFVGMKISNAIEDALGSLQICLNCGGMSEDELCFICCDEWRDESLLCIVENAKDIYPMVYGDVEDKVNSYLAHGGQMFGSKKKRKKIKILSGDRSTQNQKKIKKETECSPKKMWTTLE